MNFGLAPTDAGVVSRSPDCRLVTASISALGADISANTLDEFDDCDVLTIDNDEVANEFIQRVANY